MNGDREWMKEIEHECQAELGAHMRLLMANVKRDLLGWLCFASVFFSHNKLNGELVLTRVFFFFNLLIFFLEN